MKKTVMSILVSLSAVLFLASFSFAGQTTNYTYDENNAIGVGLTGADIALQPSPGVSYDYSAIAAGSGGTGQTCHLAAANEKGTKAYGSASDFEGMMVTIDDYDETETFPNMPDEGTAWDATAWMVLGSPGAAVPGS